MSSIPTPAILVENPKLENESWETWGERLAEKYKTPASTPHLLPVPGFELPQTWAEYGTQWKDYYNKEFASKSVQTKGPTLPPFPHSGAPGSEWATWGKAAGEAWTKFAAEHDVDLLELIKDLKYPETPTNDDWATYSREWGVYTKEVGERFKAALANKSA